MVCHECGRTVEPEDRFCNSCGSALDATTAVTDTEPGIEEPGAGTDVERPHTDTDPTDRPTELLPVDAGTTSGSLSGTDADEAWDNDPVWAATGAVPAQSVDTTDLPATEPVTEVAMAVTDVPAVEPASTPYDFVHDEPATAAAPLIAPTTQIPAATYATVPPPKRFSITAVTVIGAAGAITIVIAMFTTILSVTTSVAVTPGDEVPFGFRTGTWIADDLADNMSIAGLIAAVLMMAGAVASGFHWRWGSGLAGGAGLAATGICALMLGITQIPIDAAHEFVVIPNEQQFTLAITRDVGYWLLLAVAALGIVLFFASLNDAGNDHRPGLNPWIAALGALATVVMAAGPLIPENMARFSDNWYLVEGPGEPPALLLVVRLVQLGLLAFTGVFGYLMVRRYGLGVAIGGALPAVWLGISTLFEVTDSPVGPGYRNPGADSFDLHGVTIIGMTGVVAIGVLAIVAAYDQGVRERP